MNQMSETDGYEMPEEGFDQPIGEMDDILRGESEEVASDDSISTSGGTINTDIIMNIPVEVQIVLGSTEMSVSEIMALQKGSTVALDRRIGEPVDVVVNGRKIARGEITVIENDPSRFGIRLTEITGAKPSR